MIFSYNNMSILINKISVKEMSIVIGLAFILFICVFLPERELVNLRQIDTVYFMEMLSNVAKSGQPLSMANHSSWDVVPTLTMDAETLCKNPLIPTQPLYKNAFDNHAYYILFAFSPLVWVVPVKTLGPLLHVLPFVLFVLIVYLFLRKQGVGCAASILFCILIIAHPNWSQALQGQYYVDRWFLPFGLVLAILSYQLIWINKPRWPIFTICLVAVGTAAIHERAALSVGGFLIALCMLYIRDFNNRKYLALMLWMGFLLVVYALFIGMSFKGYDQPSNTDNYITFFSEMKLLPSLFNNEEINQNLTKFLAVNFLFLGLLSLAAPRMALIAFAAMLPNILGDIGGAEKTGWSTHYHTIYFPFIVLAAALGYISLCHRFHNYTIKATALYTSVCIAIVGQLTFDPYPGKFNFTAGQIRNNALVMAYHFITEDDTVNAQRFLADQRHQLAAAVPLGAVVTSEEGYFPVLYEGRTVLNYPIGIDTADYAVISYAGLQDGKPFYAPPLSLLGSKMSKRIASCMYDRLIRAGYNVETPQIISASGIAILRRSAALTATASQGK